MNDEGKEDFREQLTEEAVLMVEKCERSQRPDGRHDWRVMHYTQNIHHNPTYMYGSIVGYEHLGSETTIEMRCFCGVSVNLKREGR